MTVLVITKGVRKYLTYICLNFNFISKQDKPRFISYNRHSLQLVNQVDPLNKSGDNGKIKDKIVYNSVIKAKNYFFEQAEKNKSIDERFLRYKREGPPVIALKYFSEEAANEKLTDKEQECIYNAISQHEINLPYKRVHHVDIPEKLTDSVVSDVYESDSDNCKSLNAYNSIKDNSSVRPKKHWITDYNAYAEVSFKQTNEEDSDDEDDTSTADLNYGTANPNHPPSLVPCGGCGAHLHCQDPSIPGFLPVEIFAGLRPHQLQSLVCQRCHFLREYNTALSVNVDPAVYPQLLSQIKGQKALVILVVDMSDFPCSIWPGILNIIGPKRPLVVVGNKIDLLQDWSRDMLKRAKLALNAQLPRRANVLHTALVSAKTGFGIEDLINALYNLWEYRGDVYLVGCTNVGKSMLFNALLQSDYCKTKAVDLIQRATTAPWPGTTLNLLKFPITRPDGWRLAVRSARLVNEGMKELQRVQEGNTQATPQMISRINRTFAHGNTNKYSDEYWDDPFAMPKMATLRELRTPGSGIDPEDPILAQSKWLYDTPGVITPDQIIDLLTTEELMLTLPRETLVPRTFTVWTGQSLLVGGLGRVDYITGTRNIKMTVLAAATLPVTICSTVDVEEVYNHYIGSDALAVPRGGPDRLRLWPGLKAGPEFVLKGIGWQESCGDVVLSSAGWVAVTAFQDSMCQLQGWTPEGRGVHVRTPPLLPRAIAVKGQRMFKSPAYALFNENIKMRRTR